MEKIFSTVIIKYSSGVTQLPTPCWLYL